MYAKFPDALYAIGFLTVGFIVFLTRIMLYGLLKTQITGVAKLAPFMPPILEILYFRNRSKVGSVKWDLIALSGLLGWIPLLVLARLLFS